MDIAAEAALLGWPMEAVLGLSNPVEQTVALEVLYRALAKKAKQRKQLLEDLEIVVHNGFVKAMRGK